MAVTKTAGSEIAAPGETLNYTIVVTNLGPDAAEEAVLTDTTAAQLLDPEYAISGGAFQPWPGSLVLGTIAPGETRTILLRGTVSDLAAGSLANTARVTAVTPDPDPENNTSTAVIFISGPREQAVTDIIESVVLEEAALAHILNAEGEKLQRIIALPDSSADLLLQVDRSVRSMTIAVTMLETILSSKLALFADSLCGASASGDPTDE